MNTLLEILGQVGQAPAWDVLMPGYIDPDETVPVCHPASQTCYIALDPGFLRLTSTENSGQLRVELADEVSYLEALDAYEDVQAVILSYGTIFFAENPPVRCIGARYATDEDSLPSAGLIKCLELEFEFELRLFIDPTWPFGIRLSGAGVYDPWLESYRPYYRNLTGHIWEPIEGRPDLSS